MLYRDSKSVNESRPKAIPTKSFPQQEPYGEVFMMRCKHVQPCQLRWRHLEPRALQSPSPAALCQLILCVKPHTSSTVPVTSSLNGLTHASFGTFKLYTESGEVMALTSVLACYCMRSAIGHSLCIIWPEQELLRCVLQQDELFCNMTSHHSHRCMHMPSMPSICGAWSNTFKTAMPWHKGRCFQTICCCDLLFPLREVLSKR